MVRHGTEGELRMLPQSNEGRRPDTAPPNGHADGWRGIILHAPAEIGPVLDEVVGQLVAAEYSRKEVFGIRLALEEAIVNAIKHGHRGDAAKEVRLRYRVTAAETLAEVEDQGPGFDPAAVPDPLSPENCERDCGRGLFLMRSYMTSVLYNQRGTCVTLCKRRTPE